MRALLPLYLALALVVPAAERSNDPRFEQAAELSRRHGGISMVVQIDGIVVYEEYANGGSADRASELASGTKSFVGVLALCAREDRLLDLDEKVAATLGEWRDDLRRSEVTIRDLLTLTSGIPGGESALKTGRVPSYAEAIAVPATAERGTKFSYGPQPFQVFGELLRRKLQARETTVMRYLEQRILEPLAIKPGRWRKDAQGNPNLPSGAALTARDWTKFGEAVRLDGRGFLPPGRMAECFRGTKVNPGYGLTWWLPGQGPYGSSVQRDARGPWLPRDTWMAAGAGGQRLVIVPSLKLVAVRQAPVRRQAEGAFPDRQWLRALLEPLPAAAR